jgi:hypothetical protein
VSETFGTLLGAGQDFWCAWIHLWWVGDTFGALYTIMGAGETFGAIYTVFGGG